MSAASVISTSKRSWRHLLAHALLTHRPRDAEAKQQVLHAVRHRPRRREVADATRATSGHAGRARDREQPAEEDRQLTAWQSEHCVGDATLRRHAEQAVARGDGLDAISRATPRHDTVRDMPSPKRNRAHSRAIGVHDKVGNHQLSRGGSANTEPPATR